MVEAKMDCLEHRPRFVEEIQDVSVMSYSNKCGIVASVAGGLRFLLGPIAQNWRSLTCCEPIPQAAHSLQPRLAVAKKKFGTGVHLKLAPNSTYMKHHETMVNINIILCVEMLTD